MRLHTKILTVSITLLLVGCQHSTPPYEERVTIGMQTSPAMALLMVAQDKGFFAAEGLQVELKQFTAGKFALEAFLAGSLDFAVSGDVPPLLAALQGHTFLVPAQVVRSTVNEVRVVARRDAHALSAREYFMAKKRSIATSIGGGPEFFTYEFLQTLGLSSKDVEIVSQKPGDMPAALTTGSVDAIAIFDPFAFIAEKQMGQKAITFTDASVYSQLYVLEAHESVRNSPETLLKVLRALIAAEVFVRSSPDEAKEIVMEYTKLDRPTMNAIWPSFDFRIALTPQLLKNWEKQVRWAKETGKADQSAPSPDLRSYLFLEPLRSIDPERVSL